MRFIPVLLAVGCGALSASAVTHAPYHDVTPAIHAHILEARSPLSLSLGGINICIGSSCNRPSQSWKCSGSGHDGYAVDYSGNGRPSWTPSGFLYFGADVGWAPPAGWTCSSSWTVPDALHDKLDLVTWWKPPSSWLDAHIGIALGFTAPSWWGFVVAPTKGWMCDGSGSDGYSVDYNGDGCPTWVPTGWAWFGAGYGWQPVKGWSCGSTWEIPSQWRTTCSKATWWSPGSGWIAKHKSRDFGWSLPSHWGLDDCGCSCGCGAGDQGMTTLSRSSSVSTPAPSSTTACATTTSMKDSSTSTEPAATTSSKAKTTTTSKPAATTSSKAKTTTTSKPAATTSSKPKTTTSKKPVTSSATAKTSSCSVSEPAAPTSTKKPATSTSASAKTSAARSTKTVTDIGKVSTATSPGNIHSVTRTVLASKSTSTGRPSYSWTCDGSGRDGYEVDWKGNGRPSYYPEGWYWFGVAVGWAPDASWVCNLDWSPSSVEITVIVSAQVTWWLPPARWKLPQDTNCPTQWTSQGWIDLRIPSASWQCDGSGEDGYDFDEQGHAHPSGADVGWKYFGRSHGWQPCKTFKLPSADWVSPSWWTANDAAWWRPTQRWNLRHSFKCPTFWRASRSYLRGSWVWS